MINIALQFLFDLSLCQILLGLEYHMISFVLLIIEFQFAKQNPRTRSRIYSIFFIKESLMSQNSASANRKGGPKASGNEIAVPLHNILRRLALKPVDGQQLFPSTWSSLRVHSDLETETQVSTSLNVHYQLQHDAWGVFDPVSKKWRIEGDGDATLLKILGVIGSKKHGARVIQLPNHTHKVVAGIINGESLLNLFSAPVISSDGKKVTLTPKGSNTVTFAAVVPQYKTRSSSSTAKVESKSQYKHFEYILHSGKKEEKTEERSHLTWTQSPRKTMTVVNGSDVEELSQYKTILEALRNDFEDSNLGSIETSKREVLEKRLLLLEHEIDGLLKRKINFTSKDASGTRFLDYTTLLNEKENEIIALHKKIENLQNKLKSKKESQNHLKTEIERLKEVVKTVNNPNLNKQDIDNLLLSHIDTVNLHKQTLKIKKNAASSKHILKSHLDDLKLKGVKIDHEEKLRTLIDEDKDVDVSVKEGVVHMIETRDKLVEVPLQDAKTKELIKQMGLEIHRIYAKYPKVKQEANPEFLELLNKEVINVVDADGLSKITEIVRYMPSLVKVQNVYNINNEKQRKLEFHLKVLLKALLIEFQKIKAKTGVTPEVDEEVIKMIHEQIGDSVSVDDILKVFQVNQKIVQVPKIVEKIVERVIEVPTIIPIEKIVQKIVENTKIQEVEKIIHVPVEVLKYVDRIVQKIVQVQVIKEKVVQIPKIIQKIIERRVEVPKIIEVEVIKEKIIEKEKPVIVEKVVNHPVPEIKEVEVIKHQTVVVKQVEEKIKEVEKIVEKIVQRVVEKPVIIEVEKIVQKLVNTVNYKPAREVVNYVEHVPQIVERIIQKIIPIIQTVEKIKEVPKIVEKIVQVRVQVPTVKEVKVIEERIVYQDRVKEVERVIEKVVPLINEVIKQVERRVQVPIIQEKIVTVKEVLEKVVPQKYQTVKIVEVEKIVEKLVEVIKIMEVQKPVVKYITIEKPVKVIVQTIVEVPKIVEKIKEVRVPVDKIIEKLVEVPKVVEVQKIVEKIVVVPRIVEKIIQVPQIVQKIVDRIVQVEKIKQIIKEVQVPIIQERVVEVEVIKNIEVPVYKQVEVIREKVVSAIQEKQVLKHVDVVQEKIVQSRIEIPKQIVKEKIVPHTVEVEKIVQIQKALVIPFEVPVPCDKVVEKLVVVEKNIEKTVEVPVTVQKIIETIKEMPVVKEITKIQQQPIIQEKFTEIEKIVPYITEKVTEVEVIREKPVLAPQIEERIKQVAAYQDKIVAVTHQVPKIYEIEKIVQKPVEVPKFIEITAKQPVIIINNKIVDRLVDKIVHTNTVEEKIVEVPTVQEKIITVEKLVQEIKQIHVNNDKIVQKEKLINRTNVENKIETKYQTVDRIEQKLVPVSGSTERIVEVPHLMQKVVQRIVLMPQVHQVTQHVFDIHEQANPGVAVDVDFNEHQAQYNKLYKSLKKDSDSLVSDLKAMKKSHPELTEKIQSVENYITQLDKLNAFPKIVQVTKDKVVNRDVAVPVLLSNKSQKIKNQAFYLVLIEKLIKELKNAKTKASYAIEDEQIKLLFLSKANKDDDKKLKEKIEQFKNSPEGQKYTKFKSDQSALSDVLYDKFYLASQLEKSKLQTERFRRISEQRLELLHRFKQTNDVLHQRLVNLEDRIRTLLKKDGSSLNKNSLQKLKQLQVEIQEINELLFTDIKKLKINEPIQSITKDTKSETLFRLQESKIRELEAEVQILKKEYVETAGSKTNPNESADKDRVIDSLRKTITHLVDNKGTKTTLAADDERRETISSLDKIGDKAAKQTIKNETSIIGFLSNSPIKERYNEWEEYPIIKQEQNVKNQENFGYIILPDGRAEKQTKSYKVIQNRQNDSYIIIPVGDNKKEVKEGAENYPFGNPWLPYGREGEENKQKIKGEKNDNKNKEKDETEKKNQQTSRKMAHTSVWVDPKDPAAPKPWGSTTVDPTKPDPHNINPNGHWVDPKDPAPPKPWGSITADPHKKSDAKSAIGQLTLHSDPNSANLSSKPTHNAHLVSISDPPINVSSPKHVGIAQSHVEQIKGGDQSQVQFIHHQPSTIIIPAQPSEQNLHFNYQQPGTIILPNLIDPNNVLALPGQASRVTYVDQNGAVINSFNQSGQLEGQIAPGGSYSATYLYKSEVKQSGQGQHKYEKTITEIRTNQTVNWISRSRVIDTDIKIESPRKDSPMARITISPKKEDTSPPKKEEPSPPKK